MQISMATEKILEIAHETARQLSHAGYKEASYQCVLQHLLEKEEFIVRSEVGVVYKLSDGFCFGHGRIDLVVTHTQTAEVFILELKANVRPNLRAHLGQLSRYLRHYRSPVTHGLLLYFNSWDNNIMHHILG
jgi:GxxExxY protein